MDSKKFSPDVQTGFLSDETTRSYFSRLGFATFALGLAALVSAYLLGLIASNLFPAEMLKDRFTVVVLNHIINVVSIYAVAAPLFCVIAGVLPSIRPFRSRMGFGSFLGGFCICIAAMTLGNYLSSVLLLWVETIFGSVPSNPVESMVALDDPAMVIVTISFMVILVPALEELLFRRILCSKLMPLGEGYAIFLSGAIFALMHGNLYQIPYAFLVGAFLGFIYVKTGRLVYTIIYHALFNFLGSVVAPYLSSLIDNDKVIEIIESGDVETAAEYLPAIIAISAYSTAIIGLTVVGCILFFKAKKRKRLSLEQGILPPPRKHRMGNLFLNTGVAAAIAFFAFYLVIGLR